MTVHTDLPVDIWTMRSSADRLLAPDAEAPSAQELETLTLALKGHLAVIIPDLGRAASSRRGDDSMPRVCARMAIAETCRKMDIEPGPAPSARLAHARRLARSLNALCRHYEILNDRKSEAGE